MQPGVHRLKNDHQVTPLLRVLRLPLGVLELPDTQPTRQLDVVLGPAHRPKHGGEGPRHVAGPWEVEVHPHLLRQRFDVLLHERHPGV